MDDQIIKLFAFIPPLLLVSITFRLAASNTFVDHRKAALRTQLKEKITKCSELIFVIQSLGKVPALRLQEQNLFSSLGAGYKYLVDEIYSIRNNYSRLLNIFLRYLCHLAWNHFLFYVFQGKSGSSVNHNFISIGYIMVH